MFLGKFFVKNAKIDPITLFERPKSAKSFKSGKYRNCREQREKQPFSTFKTPKLSHFSRHLLKNFYSYTPGMVLSHVFRFFENSKILINIFFRITFFVHYFDFFEIFKIRDKSLIETFIFNLLMKTNCFYLVNCLRVSISRKPLFLPKTGKT